DGSYVKLYPPKDSEPIDAQAYFMEEATRLAKEAAKAEKLKWSPAAKEAAGVLDEKPKNRASKSKASSGAASGDGAPTDGGAAGTPASDDAASQEGEANQFPETDEKSIVYVGPKKKRGFIGWLRSLFKKD
ncbi:MAG: hypothetical protein ACOYIK_10150, partial [Coriobacteriales bacterium]